MSTATVERVSRTEQHYGNSERQQHHSHLQRGRKLFYRTRDGEWNWCLRDLLGHEPKLLRFGHVYGYTSTESGWNVLRNVELSFRLRPSDGHPHRDRQQFFDCPNHTERDRQWKLRLLWLSGCECHVCFRLGEWKPICFIRLL